jgi:hypothetical protein
LSFALVGYATDYANAVQEEPTPVERLRADRVQPGRVRSAAGGDRPADRRGCAGAARDHLSLRVALATMGRWQTV